MRNLWANKEKVDKQKNKWIYRLRKCKIAKP